MCDMCSRRCKKKIFKCLSFKNNSELFWVCACFFFFKFAFKKEMEERPSPAEVRKTRGWGEVHAPVSKSCGVKRKGSPAVGCRRLRFWATVHTSWPVSLKSTLKWTSPCKEGVCKEGQETPWDWRLGCLSAWVLSGSGLAYVPALPKCQAFVQLRMEVSDSDCSWCVSPFDHWVMLCSSLWSNYLGEQVGDLLTSKGAGIHHRVSR